jgi:hypothetical protein
VVAGPMSSQGWSKQKNQTKGHKVENNQNALEKAHQEKKNNTRGGKKQKKAQIIQWWLGHGAKEDGRKKTRKDLSRLDARTGYVKDGVN